MDDPLGMSMLNGPTHLDEHSEALADRQAGLVAIVGDVYASDHLHDEVRPAGVGRAGVQHLGDVRVVHQGEGLALGFKAGDDLLRIHARLDDFQGHRSAHRVLLLGDEHEAHAAFTNLLQQLVGADLSAGRLGLGVERARFQAGRGAIQKGTGRKVIGDQAPKAQEPAKGETQKGK